MKIDDGTNIDASLAKAIGISNNGTDWDLYFQKTTIIEVCGLLDGASNAVVILKSFSNIKIEFQLDDITNQATWTNNQAGLSNATKDIISWL